MQQQQQVPVLVAGAGPVGLTLALRLAQLGVPVQVWEREDRSRGEGSKALCMQRETLESWAQLGFGQQVADRGVAWALGRTYFRDTELFQTRLPATDEHFPPFVNISQTEVEQLLVAAVHDEPLVTVHWGRSVTGLTSEPSGVAVDSADGVRRTAGYVVGADGARSSIRRLAGIGFPGHSHADQFLIVDIRARLPFPAERRFWFDPPWNPGRTVLIHPQPDDVWRIDWQVPPEFDLDSERSSGRLDERIRQIVGTADYEPVWVTVYRFHQRLAERIAAGRTVLVGDAAHLFSPFGARGLNSGVADAMNLAWRLAEAVQRPGAAEDLLAGYVRERTGAAAENLAVTDATMRFMVPPTEDDRRARDAVLLGSVDDPAVRARVDSGRLAVPAVYQVPGAGPVAVGDVVVGGVLPDAPVEPVRATGARRLREALGGRWCRLLLWGGEVAPAAQHRGHAPECQVHVLGADERVPPGVDPVVRDRTGRVAARLGSTPRPVLVRPDGYVVQDR